MIISVMLIAVLASQCIYSIKIMTRGNLVGLPLLVLSLAAIFFVIYPEESGLIANLLGVGRGADLLLYLCFMAGILLILLVHLKFRVQSIMITELARSVALKNSVDAGE
jgi:small membrane protein